METFYAIGLKLIVILGGLSTAVALIIFLSCRCFPAWKPASKLMNNAKYKRFFKTHCNIWWVFWSLVAVHGIVAILYFFSPF
jgi:hypothetical protein